MFMPSKSEMERRRKAVRNMMEKNNLDVLLAAQQHEGRLYGGAIRYLTNVASIGMESIWMVVPIDGEPTLIGHRDAPPEQRCKDLGISDWRGVGINSSRDYENDGKFVAKVILEKKPKKIGLVDYSTVYGMPGRFIDVVKKELSGDIGIEDLSRDMDKIRMIKSEEEIKYHEQACATGDAIHEAMKEIVKPGMTDRMVLAEMAKVAINSGVELIGPFMITYHAEPGVMKSGDIYHSLIECSGPGGYWHETGRPVVLGSIPASLQKAWDIVKQMQTEAAKAMRPGVPVRNVLKKIDEVYPEHGITGYGAGHGQGLGVVEKPALLPDEWMSYEENIVTSIHPCILGHNIKEIGIFSWINDQFLVTKNGAKRLHKFPQEIIQV